MSFHKILVAIDYSTQTQPVFENALDLAKRENAALLVFHCIHWEVGAEAIPIAGTAIGIDPMVGNLMGNIPVEPLEHEIKRVEEMLQTYTQKATSLGITVHSQYKVGDPGISICDGAKAWGADLIVIGRTGHKGLTELLLGSVSNYVLHNAPCSVLVIQGIGSTAQTSS